MKILIEKDEIAVQRIFCIGQNYVDHIEELKNEIPASPVIFQKPPASLVPDGETIQFPGHGKNLHHEVEVVVLIGKTGKPASIEDSKSFIKGLSIGLDLTLRDVQTALRKKGLPWEAAKAFEQSAPIGRFIPFSRKTDLKNISFTCEVNGKLRQNGNTKKMIYSIETLIVELGKIWTLREGDLIYTGTPAGVSQIFSGDKIRIDSPLTGSFSWTIA